jgi:hypothetical protein
VGMPTQQVGESHTAGLPREMNGGEKVHTTATAALKAFLLINPGRVLENQL